MASDAVAWRTARTQTTVLPVTCGVLHAKASMLSARGAAGCKPARHAPADSWSSLREISIHRADCAGRLRNSGDQRQAHCASAAARSAAARDGPENTRTGARLWPHGLVQTRAKENPLLLEAEETEVAWTAWRSCPQKVEESQAA